MSLFKEFQVDAEEFTFKGFDTDDEPRIKKFRFEPFAFKEPGMQPSPEMIEEAQGIVGEARKKAQHIEREAYEQGFLQGQKDGQEVGERSLDQQVQQFKELVQALAREKEELYRQREQDLLELVLLISRKIVARELKTQPEAIRDIIAGGFRILSDTEDIKLRLSPQDQELLEWDSKENWPADVELVTDGTIEPGGFIMETPSGDIDGTLENRWAVLTKLVAEALKAENEPTETD